MTDLERALRGWVTDWNGEPMLRGEPPRDGIHCDVIYDAIEALAAARREGAEEMRERAAQVAEEEAGDLNLWRLGCPMDHNGRLLRDTAHEQIKTAIAIARNIAALPLTPEEPQA